MKPPTKKKPPSAVAIFDGPVVYASLVVRLVETADGGARIEMWDAKQKAWVPSTRVDFYSLAFAPWLKPADRKALNIPPDDLPLTGTAAERAEAIRREAKGEVVRD